MTNVFICLFSRNQPIPDFLYYIRGSNVLGQPIKVHTPISDGVWVRYYSS